MAGTGCLSRVTLVVILQGRSVDAACLVVTSRLKRPLAWSLWSHQHLHEPNPRSAWAMSATICIQSYANWVQSWLLALTAWSLVVINLPTRFFDVDVEPGRFQAASEQLWKQRPSSSVSIEGQWSRRATEAFYTLCLSWCECGFFCFCFASGLFLFSQQSPLPVPSLLCYVTLSFCDAWFGTSVELCGL